MREPGYYWILLYDEWQPARWSPRSKMVGKCIGSDVPLISQAMRMRSRRLGQKLELPTDI
jgi:hypothetical protein